MFTTEFGRCNVKGEDNMKKQIATVLTAALLAFPVSTGVVMAETTTTPDTTTINTPVTTTGSTDTATTNTSANQGSTTTTTNTPTGTTTTGDTTSTSGTTTGDTAQTGVQTPVVDADGNTVEAGTLPDSPLYWFESLIKKIQVALTFDPVKKTKLITEQASEDLAEATELAVKGDEENVEKALTRYNDKITKAQEYLEQVKDPESEESQKLQTALTKVNANNVLVLGGLLEKLPPQAAERLALNIVRAMEKAVDKADKMDKKNGHVDQDDQAKESTTETDSTTTPVTEATPGTTVTPTDSTANGTVEADPVSNEAATTLTKEEFKALSQEAKKALEEFRVALGLKKGPQGNAYGYYYRAHQDKEWDKENVKQGTAASVAQTQSVDQNKSVQEPKQVESAKQVQPSNTQPVQKSDVKNTYSKQQKSNDHGNQDRDDENGKKDKGNRDRD